MTTQRRVATTIAITALLLVVSIGFGVQRSLYWHHKGWNGVSAQPWTGKQPAHTKRFEKFLMPGRIGMVYPHASASRAGLQADDVILSINGIAYRDVEALRRLDRSIHVGDTITYRVRRGDQERSIRVVLESPFRRGIWAVSLILSLFVAAIYVVIGLLVFLRKPDDRRAILFNAMSIVAAVAIIAGASLAFDGSGSGGIVFEPTFFLPIALLAILALAGLPITLHLALVFPRERPIVAARPYIIRWIYAVMLAGAIFVVAMAATMQAIGGALERYARQISLLALIIALCGLVVALRVAYAGRREGVARAFAMRPLQTLFAILAGVETAAVALHYSGLRLAGLLLVLASIVALVLIVISYPVLTIVALYRSYRDAGVEEKRQVKWPLWGTLIAIAIKVLCFAATILMTTFITLHGRSMDRWFVVMETLSVTPRLASLLIPISFAIAIFKYRLMNIDIIIRKTVSYAFLSGAIVVIYIILVGGAGTLLISFAGVKSTTMVIASTIVVALVFVPLRSRLQTLVDRNLFRHRYQYPEALRAISADAVNAKDAGTLLFMAAEKLQQALQNRSVVCFVRRQDEMVAAEKVGVADSIVGSLRVPATPLPDATSPALAQIESALVAPLRTQSGAHGFISFGAKLSNGAFDEEDVAFIGAAADQLAVAIERIRLQREEADFEQARTMQQSLLPREMPRVAGLDVAGTWQPARAVGGDYYDLLELSATQLAVCIGDVAGKGMSAALLMSGLQAAVRASAGEDVAPRELCERVRRVVVSSLTGGRFVTFFFCTIDTTARRVRWCNAGHNASLLVRADGSVERLATGGPVFSRVFRDPYAEGEVPLQAGDRLLLFTDGASEAQARDGEMFGETRLEELVVAHRHENALNLQRIIVDAVLAFSGAELEDDLTLVVVAFSNSPAA